MSAASAGPPPGTRTIVHLVRHGEVDNPAGVLYGRLPGYHLSARGHDMAKRLAVSLAESDVAAVLASPLARAQETATPIAAAHELALGTDERLVESANVFEGKRVSVGDGALGRPGQWRHLWNPFRPSWGEPYRDIADRVLAAVADVRDRVAGREAVCVSHQLPVWTARRALEGRRLWHDPRRRQCSLASVTSLVYDGDRLAEIGYAEPAADL